VGPLRRNEASGRLHAKDTRAVVIPRAAPHGLFHELARHIVVEEHDAPDTVDVSNGLFRFRPIRTATARSTNGRRAHARAMLACRAYSDLGTTWEEANEKEP
jgi:hypothetical protein